MNVGNLLIRDQRSFQYDTPRIGRKHSKERALCKHEGLGMDMYYVFLSIGGAGTAIVAVLNLFAWLWLDKNTAIPFGVGWYNGWLPNYLVWLSCLGLGLVFWLFARKQKRH